MTFFSAEMVDKKMPNAYQSTLDLNRSPAKRSGILTFNPFRKSKTNWVKTLRDIKEEKAEKSILINHFRLQIDSMFIWKEKKTNCGRNENCEHFRTVFSYQKDS